MRRPSNDKRMLLALFALLLASMAWNLLTSSGCAVEPAMAQEQQQPRGDQTAGQAAAEQAPQRRVIPALPPPLPAAEPPLVVEPSQPVPPDQEPGVASQIELSRERANRAARAAEPEPASVGPPPSAEAPPPAVSPAPFEVTPPLAPEKPVPARGPVVAEPPAPPVAEPVPEETSPLYRAAEEAGRQPRGSTSAGQ